MIGRTQIEAIVALLGHSAAWLAHTEQLWFPMTAAYVRYIAPVYELPDLRGPFAAITLVYLGLRMGDWLNERNEIEETL